MMTWAFIPAREKSVRFPQKNAALFQGEPLVVRAVRVAEEAQRIGLINRIVVLTDQWGKVEGALRDAKIVTVRDRCLVARRPTWLRDDPTARVIDLLRYCLGEAKGEATDSGGDPMNMWPRPDVVCVLLPTSPLRTLRHLVESYRLLIADVDVVLSVTPFRQDIRGTLTLEPDGRILHLDTAEWPKTSIWKHDGQVAWLRADYIVSEETKLMGFYGENVVGYPIPPEESADVDVPLDLEWAEFLYTRRT